MSIGRPTILITGAAGFLGRAIIRELQKPDAAITAREVRAIDIQPIEQGGGGAAKVDIRDVDDLRAVCEGYRMSRRSLPKPLMYGIGCALELGVWLLRSVRQFKPVVSRFAVSFVCQDYTFVSDRAARDLGYRPIYSEEEAFARTIAYYRDP